MSLLLPSLLQHLWALAQDPPASPDQLPTCQRPHRPQWWLLHGALPASLQKRRLLPVQQGSRIWVCLPVGPWSVQNNSSPGSVSVLVGHAQLSHFVPPLQARGSSRSSWHPTSSRPSRSGSGSWELGSLGRSSLQSLSHLLLSWGGSGSVTRGGRGHQATERDSHYCKAAQRKAHPHIRLLCNAQHIQMHMNVQNIRGPCMNWLLASFILCLRDFSLQCSGGEINLWSQNWKTPTFIGSKTHSEKQRKTKFSTFPVYFILFIWGNLGDFERKRNIRETSLIFCTFNTPKHEVHIIKL